MEVEPPSDLTALPLAIWHPSNHVSDRCNPADQHEQDNHGIHSIASCFF